MARRRRGSGEGTVYKRADGSWAAAFDLGVVEGKRRRRFVYGCTQKEVLDKLALLRRQQTSGARLTTPRLTVGQYLDHWLHTTLPRSVRPSTEANYATLTRLYLIPGLGRIRLEQLTPADVRAFLREQGTRPGARERPLSARTIQYLHAVLRRALEHARRDELVARNVAALVEPPRVRREEVVPLSVDDARRLLDTARGRRLYALYSVALAVGLRRGEALVLRWELVNLAGGTLRVAASLQRLDGRLVLAEPKTPRSRRTVPLPGVCVEALAAHRQAQQRERDRSAYWEDHGLVFTTIIGTPIDPRNLVRSFYVLCDDAGVRRIRFHDLRHTCASLLLAQGVEPRVIMDTLGHSTIGTTLNLYAHVMPAMQCDAAAQMDSLLR